jgi:penicillin-binding protein 1A
LLTPLVGSLLGSTWPMPENVRTIPTYTTKPTYYSEAIKDYLFNRATFLGDEQQRANLLYRGGLQIHTTLDPNLQSLAEQARNQLPDNQQGFDASIVTLDTKTGAIRAMVGGHGFQPRVAEINMALVPRQTGSAIKFFILAAALQAGAQPTDIIDGTAPCTLPDPLDAKKTFDIGKKVRVASRPPGTLESMTWASINCAYSRLAQIIGGYRVVDSIYRMADSIYLNPGLPNSKSRPTLVPYGGLAIGFNPMAPIDMASGMQTIANQGLHHDPYYVDYIDRVDGTRLYTQSDPGVQVLDPDVALTAVSTLKGVLSQGTAKAALSKFPFPATGKTGTQDDNTNSWFVGASPQLTTAVWVGDPDAYTPMVNIPEFLADGVKNVQGGTYPAKIWGAFMEPALTPLPLEDWPAAPELTRKAVRLYLPGNECLAKLVSGDLPVPGTTTTSTTSTLPPAPDGSAPPVTEAPKPVLKVIPSETTVPPDVLDPKAPIPTIPIAGTIVYACDKPPPGVILTGKTKTTASTTTTNP